nr:hypothetical protein GCM10025699_01270 [Microbacterium flavescens]
MGAGIAHAFALAGADVVVVERDEEAAGAASARVLEALRRSVDRGTTSRPINVLAAALTTATDAAAFAGCGLVVEAVPEDRELKVAALSRAERALEAGAVLATNTSSISIDDLAAALERPDRFVGLHFFNPVPASLLVEVVVGAATEDAVADAARSWVEQIGKTAVVVRDAPGFASSRLGVALGLEAIRMVEEGVASPADIDAAMELGYRHPVGPCARPTSSAWTCASASPRSCTRGWATGSHPRTAAAHGRRRTTGPQDRPRILRMERVMTDILPSYVLGEWWTPADASAAVTVADASTGEAVIRVSTEGLDLAAVLDFARTTGQGSLGALTFHQRAMLLKQFAIALTERKQDLYDLSKRAGATERDSLNDVDGGIGVLFTYSSKGRRELPDGQVYLDGPVESLSKDGSFLGRHVYTRLPGVAVQINAFNFPMWGALEKFAPAFLAGVPTVVKPATPTVYVAEAWVRVLVDTGLLPDGSLQLVCGSVPGLFDHLRLGDLVGFTGSASTADRLRAHPSIQTGGVRFTNETDSINASVLGPDAVAGTPEFDAYVKQLMVELTTKAGQKCTAIRRAIVPEGSVDDLVAAVRAKVAERVVLGDPHAAGVTMGPSCRWHSATRCCVPWASSRRRRPRAARIDGRSRGGARRRIGRHGPGRRVRGAAADRVRGCLDRRRPRGRGLRPGRERAGLPHGR